MTNESAAACHSSQVEEAPFFSVIVPTYNRARFLGEALESIFRQTYGNYEVIVIDDGSQDNTREVLQSFHGNIHYLFQENQGVSVARNTGIRSARGKWIAFLDSDDQWLPGYLARQREHIRNHPECCLHMTDSLQVARDGRETSTFADNPSLRFWRDQVIKPADPFCFIMRYHLYYLQPTVIAKTAVEAAGGFNPDLSLAEDLDMVARAAARGPIALHRSALVRIIRRDEEQPSLTEQIFTDGIRSQNAIGSIYSNLLAMKNLDAGRRKLLRRLYGANRRATGNLFVRAGKRDQAFAHYLTAFRTDFSWRSLLRMVMLVLPDTLLLRTIDREWKVTP